MTEIVEEDIKLQNDLDIFEKEVSDISKKKDFIAKKKQVTKCNQLSRQIQISIDSYELEVNNLQRDSAAQFLVLLASINKRFKELKNGLKLKQNEAEGQQVLMDQRNNNYDDNLDVASLNQKEAIQFGHQLQDKGIEKLKLVERDVINLNEQANEINQKLDEQIEQLDRMHGTLKDTQSVLKRTKVMIRYFGRAMYTDKIIMGLCCLILVAIIVCFVVAALNKDDGNLNVPDQVRGGR